jgi:hypothetical protein
MEFKLVKIMIDLLLLSNLTIIFLRNSELKNESKRTFRELR